MNPPFSVCSVSIKTAHLSLRFFLPFFSGSCIPELDVSVVSMYSMYWDSMYWDSLCLNVTFPHLKLLSLYLGQDSPNSMQGCYKILLQKYVFLSATPEDWKFKSADTMLHGHSSARDHQGLISVLRISLGLYQWGWRYGSGMLFLGSESVSCARTVCGLPGP